MNSQYFTMPKRPYSDMIPTLSELPELGLNNQAAFKSSLPGQYNLRVAKIVDISKPADKPVEDIDEPEDNDVALENQLSKSNARMIQLNLRDSKNADINAIETERIELLSSVKLNSVITIAGPVDVRCRNIMLERKHVVSIDEPQHDEQTQIVNAESSHREEPRHDINIVNLVRVEPVAQDIDTIMSSSRVEPAQMIDLLAPLPREESQQPKIDTKPPIQVVELDEDWAEDWDDDDEDDCIILD